MNRIKEIREALGLTQAQLGEMMGTSDATIQRLETTKRQLTEKWIRLAAKALKVTASEILGDIIPPSPNGLLVIGRVQAGVWRENFEDESREIRLPIGRDPRYPHAGQFALEVLGNSMDKVFPEGQYIVCAKWSDVGREVRHNDLVVVYRHENGKTESTVKRAKLTRGKMMLWPESNDPQWQTPVPYSASPNGSDEVEVVVHGLVIGRYQPL